MDTYLHTRNYTNTSTHVNDCSIISKISALCGHTPTYVTHDPIGKLIIAFSSQTIAKIFLNKVNARGYASKTGNVRFWDKMEENIFFEEFKACMVS